MNFHIFLLILLKLETHLLCAFYQVSKNIRFQNFKWFLWTSLLNTNQWASDWQWKKSETALGLTVSCLKIDMLLLFLDKAVFNQMAAFFGTITKHRSNWRWMPFLRFKVGSHYIAVSRRWCHNTSVIVDDNNVHTITNPSAFLSANTPWRSVLISLFNFSPRNLFVVAWLKSNTSPAEMVPNGHK